MLINPHKMRNCKKIPYLKINLCLTWVRLWYPAVFPTYNRRASGRTISSTSFETNLSYKIRSAFSIARTALIVSSSGSPGPVPTSATRPGVAVLSNRPLSFSLETRSASRSFFSSGSWRAISFDLLSRVLWQFLIDWLWVQVSLWYRDSEFASVNGEEVDEAERAAKVTRGNLIYDLGLLEAMWGRDGEKWRRGLEAAVAICEETGGFEPGVRIYNNLYKIVGYLRPLAKFTTFEIYMTWRGLIGSVAAWSLIIH